MLKSYADKVIPIQPLEKIILQNRMPKMTTCKQFSSSSLHKCLVTSGEPQVKIRNLEVGKYYCYDQLSRRQFSSIVNASQLYFINEAKICRRCSEGSQAQAMD